MSNRPAPPSMPAGSHEMQNYYSNQDPPRPTPYTAPSITPYLGLRARLSQVWINRWTILLLLVLARSLIAVSGLKNDLDSARREALSACSSVESMGSAMASMPHYMAQGVNELTATGVERAVNGLMEMTTMSVTGVEEIVLFVINMMTSTYVCLITLAVGGSLHVALKVVEDAQDALNKAIDGIGEDMGKAVQGFEDTYKSFIDALDKVSLGFLNTADPPELDLSKQIDSLNNLKLPGDLSQGLDKLNNSIPTFAEVQNFTDNAIRLPFKEVKLLMKNAMGNYTFDRSVFPVPQREQLTFCSDNNSINNFFDDLLNLAHVARTIFLGVLLTAAILICIPMAWREIKRWRTMQERSQLVHSNAHDPMDVVYIVSRPYTSSTGIKVANRFKSPRRQILTRWVIAYATSTPALFVLSLGVAGLFSCACQAVMLRALEREVPNLASQVGAFADQVVTSLNNASEQWAIGTNKAIAATNEDINSNLFGWVNTTTGAVNDTLNVFVDGVSGVLNDTFGGTVLYDPIKEVLNCLVLLKVAGIQKALTWVSENARIDFPLMANDTFSLGAVASIASANDPKAESFLSEPGDAAKDKISSIVVRMTNRIEDGIRTEALISTVVLLIWVAILLIGIIRALTLWFGKDKTRAEGGVGDAYQSNRAGFQDIALDTYHPERPASGGLGPAPEYTRSNSTGEDAYSEHKLGFAGQRNYDSSLRKEATKGGHNRVSSHAEVYPDYKR
ncbi:Plasma membrane fusion protein PRM1 [Endocarpon pusillum Z07020]|uniref:Plasma membrane fusion protein PRM1 n=1 Tax=Endocarpon pusillum (strain Z07020 / HMAS-L-300199) TaxID=1263415 RepID=U1HXQ1_ENDPU|nr:Plasma membrane fusion protein PRM1 [Endocarpon pusillum Z07020]ERF74229.1 Plasma membrane fusion protein PRM1 [Endocarpon pusillum Z07020]